MDSNETIKGTFLLFSIDFESWIFSQKINREKLSVATLKKLDEEYTLESLQMILSLLEKYHQKITFFLVFQLEELYPGIIEKILSKGHEVAWHGHTHAFIKNEAILADELEKSQSFLRKYRIRGYRAPGIQFIKNGYKILEKNNFLYSSSVYGNSNYSYRFHNILEIPISVSNDHYSPTRDALRFPSPISIKSMVTQGIPYGSGYFWKILGKEYYKKKLNSAIHNKRIVNFFVHNWQILKANSHSSQYRPDEQTPFFENPLFFPYTIELKDMFEHFLSRYTFTPFYKYAHAISKV